MIPLPVALVIIALLALSLWGSLPQWRPRFRINIFIDVAKFTEGLARVAAAIGALGMSFQEANNRMIEFNEAYQRINNELPQPGEPTRKTVEDANGDHHKQGN